MGEFQELERHLSRLTLPALTAYTDNGKWVVKLSEAGTRILQYEEYRLDTALTLVLQDLRDMANE